MRNRTLILILCLGNFLFGCSSKPGASDIQNGLNEFWGTCATVSDVTKTNGIEQDNSYHVAFTYELEIPATRSNCSFANNLLLINIYTSAGNTKGIQTGDTYTINAEYNMIKSENGWIFQ
jgi:hypothetical protein